MTVLRVINRGSYQPEMEFLDEHEGIKKSAHKKVLITGNICQGGYQNDRFACYL